MLKYYYLFYGVILMKIIHLADLHIGSKFERMPEDIKNNLNAKLRNAFLSVIYFAKKNNIFTILMSGDIFDRNSVLINDKKFFYDSIRVNPNIDFYYIRGNHDLASKYNDEPINLHTFDGVKSYIKDDVRISGYELSDDNSVLYNYMSFTTDKFNIMMLHGDIFNSSDRNYIDLKKLDNKNINYFALGHIHKRRGGIIGLAKYEYPGCLLGRGFDEDGDKGFLVLDTLDNTTSFYKLSDIVFERYEVSVTGKNEALVKDEILNLLGDKNSNITEIKLIGKADFEIDTKDFENFFNGFRYYLDFKNNSKLKLNYNFNENENSLRNMFINKVLENKNLDDETKENVITYGLSKLMKDGE